MSKESDVTIKGIWWLPNNPEKKILGEITYGSTSGARLSLFGHFFEQPSHDRFTVWGVTASSEEISLFDCGTKHFTSHFFGGQITAELFSVFGVKGGHFDSPNEMKFTEVTVDLSYLYEWSFRTGIAHSTLDSPRGWQLTQHLLPDVELGYSDSQRLALTFTAQLSPALGNWRMSEKCLLSLKTAQPTPYSHFERTINSLQHFLTLAISHPVYALKIEAQHEEHKQVIEGHTIYDKFEIIRMLSSKCKDQTEITPLEMLFCLKDLGDNHLPFFGRYFENEPN